MVTRYPMTFGGFTQESGRTTVMMVPAADYDADIERLREALSGLLRRYVGLVESGDAGDWDCETEPEVIAARAALISPADVGSA